MIAVTPTMSYDDSPAGLAALEEREEAKRDAILNLQSMMQVKVVRLRNRERWAEREPLTVCQWTGPHTRLLCLFHRKKVRLLPIPHARVHNPVFGWPGQREWLLHFGEDGHIYRFGDNGQIYQADLMARTLPKHITSVEERLSSMS